MQEPCKRQPPQMAHHHMRRLMVYGCYYAEKGAIMFWTYCHSANKLKLAYAEVISYNKKNLERELQNESQQQSKAKRREEEI